MKIESDDRYIYTREELLSRKRTSQINKLAQLARAKKGIKIDAAQAAALMRMSIRTAYDYMRLCSATHEDIKYSNGRLWATAEYEDITQ